MKIAVSHFWDGKIGFGGGAGMKGREIWGEWGGRIQVSGDLCGRRLPVDGEKGNRVLAAVNRRW
ncbi:MAG: hypothetical protein WBD36_10510 [Bacteroidota bacterium]